LRQSPGLIADERLRRADHRATVEKIAQVLRDRAVVDGHFVKSIGCAEVDANPAQADPLGQLPKQVPLSLNDPSRYAPWRERWEDLARPLLWSHAKYLILHRAVHG
jgi:hypothetical protein